MGYITAHIDVISCATLVPCRGANIRVDLLVVRVVRLQLHVVDRLEHSGFASLRQLLQAVLLFDDSLVNDILDGPRGT